MALFLALFLQDPGITNGSFHDWNQGAPTGWSITVGATNSSGSQPSQLGPGKDGGISLWGSEKTGTWSAVSQDINLPPDQFARIAYRFRTSGLKQEGNQFPNHFISVRTFDSSGHMIGADYRTLSSKTWSSGELITSRTGNASRIELILFLSITGQLDVKEIEIQNLRREDSFDVLARNMDLYYSYFQHKQVQWQEIVTRYRNKEAPFADQIKPMLAELKDGHIWILPPGEKKIPVFRPPTKHNYDFHSVAKDLAEGKQVGRNSLVGKTKEGFGYIAVGSLVGPERVFKELETEITARMDLSGFIVDLRANGGGYEGNGSRLARYFCDKKRIYAKAKYRSGESHNSFTTPVNRTISPRDKKSFTRPVVVLIGQACVSSGEGMALMFRSFPHATLLGQPTRGASGNPQAVTLPNGTKVWFSRWIAMDAEGIPFEGKGIQPDILIEHKGKGDPTFRSAVDFLIKQIGD